jgi:LmbE family N-acetylglucosaminyl deacetylase
MSTVAGVFAHPDDEAFGPGGTLAKLSQTNDVYIICCTDGDHQEKNLKNIRHDELLASAKILGVKKVFFLDFIDGSLNNNLYQELSEKLHKLLNQLSPDTLITFHPNGVSGHIDHIVITSVVNHLFPKLPYLKKIMYFCMRDTERSQIPAYFVHMPDGIPRSAADEVVDTSSVRSTAISAMRAHRSQKDDCDWILNITRNLPKEEYFLVRSKR